MTTQKPSPALRVLARQLLVSSDPGLIAEIIRAGSVLRLAYELLRDMAVPRGDRPLRDPEKQEDALAAFRLGDRIQVPGDGGEFEVPTDLADVAAELRNSLIVRLDWEAAHGALQIFSVARMREYGLEHVLFALEHLTPAQLEQVTAAARNAPPSARPRPAPGPRALERLERRRRNQVATLRRLAEALECEADRINEQLGGKPEATRAKR